MGRWTGPGRTRIRGDSAASHPRLSDYLRQAREVAGVAVNQIKLGHIWSGVREVRIADDAVVRVNILNNISGLDPIVNMELFVVPPELVGEDEAIREDEEVVSFIRGLCILSGPFVDFEPVYATVAEGVTVRFFVYDARDTTLATSREIRSYGEQPEEGPLPVEEREFIQAGQYTWDDVGNGVSVSWGNLGARTRYSGLPTGQNIFFQGKLWVTVPQELGRVVGAAYSPIAARGGRTTTTWHVITYNPNTNSRMLRYLTAPLSIAELSDTPPEWELVHQATLPADFGRLETLMAFDQRGVRAVGVTDGTVTSQEDPQLNWAEIHFHRESGFSFAGFLTASMTSTKTGSNANSSEHSNPGPPLGLSCSSNGELHDSGYSGGPGPTDVASASGSFSLSSTQNAGRNDKVIAIDFNAGDEVTRLRAVWVSQGGGSGSYAASRNDELESVQQEVGAACHEVGEGPHSFWFPDGTKTTYENYIGSSSRNVSHTRTPPAIDLYHDDKFLGRKNLEDADQNDRATSYTQSGSGSHSRTEVTEVHYTPPTNVAITTWMEGAQRTATLTTSETTSATYTGLLAADLRYAYFVTLHLDTETVLSRLDTASERTGSVTRHAAARIVLHTKQGEEELWQEEDSDFESWYDPFGLHDVFSFASGNTYGDSFPRVYTAEGELDSLSLIRQFAPFLESTVEAVRRDVSAQLVVFGEWTPSAGVWNISPSPGIAVARIGKEDYTSVVELPDAADIRAFSFI